MKFFSQIKTIAVVASLSVVAVAFQNCQSDSVDTSTGRVSVASVSCWRTVGSNPDNLVYQSSAGYIHVTGLSTNPWIQANGNGTSCNASAASLPSINTLRARVAGMSICNGGDSNNGTQLTTDVGAVNGPTAATVKPNGTDLNGFVALLDQLMTEGKDAGICN